MADGKIDYSALGQAIDTSWGRSSTPKTASYSVKFMLQGDRVIASYAAIVNFGSEKEMIVMKRAYAEESVAIINEVLKAVKENYKKLAGKALSSKEAATSDSIEIIGFGVHNPKRTAYYRRKTVFDLS
jgi:Ni,Fe-hydrogenase I large subunit